MRMLKLAHLFFGLLLLAACSAERESFSDILARFEHSVQDSSEAPLKKFIRQQNWPLIEGDSVLFMTRVKNSNRVFLAGDMNGWKPDSLQLSRINGTDYFYLKQSFPTDARLEYKYVVDSTYILDSLNKKIEVGGFGSNSVLFMPDYVFPKEILLSRENNVSHLDTILFNSRILKNSRNVYFYQHPQAQKNSPLLIFHDGSEYLRLAQSRIILDNLIAAQTIQPLNAIFIDPVNRMKEYWFDDDYLKMVFKELLPEMIQIKQLDKNSPLGLVGASLGGLISIYALKNYCAEIDFIISQSGALWVEEQKIFQDLDKVQNYRGKIYYDFGTFENIEEIHKKFELLLKEKNIKHQGNKFNEGHNWGNWRAHLAQALEFCIKGNSKDER